MNILNKLLLLLSLSMSPAVTVSAQSVNTDFDTFQTEEEYLADFDYLNENNYRVSHGYYYDGIYELDYTGENYIFYCFPIYYDIEVTTSDYDAVIYYSNNKYQFLTFEYYTQETVGNILLYNYVGEETEIPFLALDYIGMSQVKSQVKKYIMVTEIVNTIIEMVTGLLEGLGEGTVNFFEALFVADSGISTLGIWVIALIGLAVALGAVAWVATLIRGKQR